MYQTPLNDSQHEYSSTRGYMVTPYSPLYERS